METSCTVKITDGLYLGDECTARDQEFLLINHVGLIINMTANRIPNYYQHYDIKYLNVSWEHSTQKGEWQDLCQDIQDAREEGECVVLHGLDHIEGPACLASLYLMNKFRWSLYKTLEYMQVRIDNLTFGPHSFEMLKTIEMSLLGEKSKLSYNWDHRPQDCEQLILRNTFLNCRQGQQRSKNPSRLIPSNASTSKLKKQSKKTPHSRRVTWEIVRNEGSARIMSSSKKVEVMVGEGQDKLKNRIIMSVRKILNNSNKIRDSKERLVSSTERRKVLSTQTMSQQSYTLKKHKSSYGLISLQSVQYPQNAQSRSDSRDKHRLLTERTNSLEKQEEGKKMKMRTEGGQLNGKVVIDVCIPRKEAFKTCKSLTLSRNKQNYLPTKMKIPLRRPTPPVKKQIY